MLAMNPNRRLLLASAAAVSLAGLNASPSLDALADERFLPTA